MAAEANRFSVTETLQDGPKPVRQGEELDLGRLETYLRRHLPEFSGPLIVTQFPSGHSNLTYSITLGEQEMVLRRPPFGSKVKSAHDMGREYHVLEKVYGAYPAPKPLLYCTDESVLGAPFYVMERVRGVILRRNLPANFGLAPDEARRLSEAFIDNLAHLHALNYTALGLGELGKPQGYMERQVRGWSERYMGSKTHEIPQAEPLAAWLHEHIPAKSEATLIHNDYKFDNMVLAAENIAQIKAVLDWEMCTIGDPLADLGAALAYWVDPEDPPEMQAVHWGPTGAPGMLRRAELAQRYAVKTGRDLSNLSFYYVFAMFKLAVIIQQIYYRYFHGFTKDERFAGMGEVTRLLLRIGLNASQRKSI